VTSIAVKAPAGRDITMLQAVTRALSEEMRRDERVILMGQDVIYKVYGATGGLLEEFGPVRVRDTPISETAMIGSGVGAAMTGLRPIVDLTISTFTYVAMDQIVNQAAKNRYMFGGQANMPLVIRTTLAYGKASAAHHSDRPYPLFMQIPGLVVVAPATPADLLGLLKSSIRSDDPVLFFEDSGLWGRRGPVPEEEHLVPLGVGRLVRPGRDVTIVAISGCVQHAIKAADELAKEGIEVEVIDPRTLKPLDVDLIVASVVRTGRLVIVDPASRICGAASEIAAVVSEEAFDSLRAPVIRLTAPDVHVPFSPPLERSLFPNVEKIQGAVHAVLADRAGAPARAR
jgi:pyruvate dehydrogenase E1 component beta subunit